MADDNVHWLRNTYGPALREFYAKLLREPVPQRFKDLLTQLEADAAVADGAVPPQAGAGEGAMTRPQEPVDASE
jgi:Anti-sigma factor NepR